MLLLGLRLAGGAAWLGLKGEEDGRHRSQDEHKDAVLTIHDPRLQGETFARHLAAIGMPVASLHSTDRLSPSWGLIVARTSRQTTPIPKEPAMLVQKQETIENQTIILDGHEFLECHFQHCLLVYKGQEPVK